MLERTDTLNFNDEKRYIINRSNPTLIDMFRNKSVKKKSIEPKMKKMNKGTLRAHLSKRYKGQVAEKIIQGLDLGLKPLDLNEYVDAIENLINFKKEQLLMIGFNIFDVDEDDKIDQLDLFALTKTYDEDGAQDTMHYSKGQLLDEDEDVFIKCFSYDICTLADMLK